MSRSPIIAIADALARHRSPRPADPAGSRRIDPHTHHAEATGAVPENPL
jgi:hypothetical protein